MKTGTGTQNLLAGLDDTLDNFFKFGPRVAAKGMGKAKVRDVKDVRDAASAQVTRRKRVTGANAASPVKKSRLAGAKDVTEHSPGLHTPEHRETVSAPGTSKGMAKGKGKERRILDDVTVTLQNSPHRRTSTASRGLASPRARRPLFTSSSSKARAAKKGKETAGSSKMTSLQAEDDDEDDEDSGSGLDFVDNDVPLRLRTKGFGNAKTPHRMMKDRLGGLVHAPLPTPPSSSMPTTRTLEASNTTDDGRKEIKALTPFTFSSTISKLKAKESYLTPISVAVPRLRLASWDAPEIPAPNLELGSDSSLTSLPSSSPTRPQVESREVKDGECERREIVAGLDDIREKDPSTKCTRDETDKMYTVIPSSQTQYIHYSPTKKRTYDFFGLGTHINAGPPQPQDCQHAAEEPESGAVAIPCSQNTSSPGNSQVIYLSPRMRRKPAPLMIPSLDKGSVGNVINMVVPTSQEDEVEISILDGANRLLPGPSSRIENANLGDGEIQGPRDARITAQPDSTPNADPGQINKQSDLQCKGRSTNGIAEERTTAEGPAPSQPTQIRFINAILDNLDRLTEEAQKGIITPSQVLSMAKTSIDLDELRRKQRIQSQGQESHIACSSEAMMQSSMTEPDASQWDEDPFTLTNEAYTRHLGLSLRVGRSSDRSQASLPKSLLSRDSQNGRTGIAPGKSAGYSSCTQSSTTQPDSDEEEDPFPTLPPASSAVPPTSTAQSSAERNTVDQMLNSSQTLPDSQDELGLKGLETPRRNAGFVGPEGSDTRSIARFRRRSQDKDGQDSSQTVPDSQDEDDQGHFLAPSQSQSQAESVSTLDVMRLLDADGLSFGTQSRQGKFRRREAAEGMQENDEGEGGEEMVPSAVRDFLSIFSRGESQM